MAGRILLVDDVFTTGVTLSECCGVLRKAGVGEIHTLTLWDSLAVSDRQSTIGRLVDSERRFAKIGGLRERMVWRRLPAANRREKADSGPQATAAAKEAKWT